MSPRASASARSARMRRNGVRALVFVLGTALLAVVSAMTLGRIDFGPSATYGARFTDVSGLTAGADVRAAGVRVGRVEDLQLLPQDDVEVTFSLSGEVTLTTLTQARVRYLNLTGDRYLELTQSDDGGTELSAEDTIPVSRTTPALDLDQLFNGFRPLTRALAPREVNRLTGSLIAVTQGQAGAVEELLGQIGSFTQTLADRDQLIGNVIENLSTMLATVDDHRGDVRRLIDGMDRLLGGLARDRAVIGDSLDSIGDLTHQSDRLMRESGGELTGTLRQLRRTTDAINANEHAAERNIQMLPKVLTALARDGAYGSFFNMFICGARVKTTNPVTGGDLYTPWLETEEERCQF